MENFDNIRKLELNDKLYQDMKKVFGNDILAKVARLQDLRTALEEGQLKLYDIVDTVVTGVHATGTVRDYSIPGNTIVVMSGDVYISLNETPLKIINMAGLMRGFSGFPFYKFRLHNNTGGNIDYKLLIMSME